MSVFLGKNDFDQIKFEQNLDEFTELVNQHVEVKFNTDDPDFLEECWAVAGKIGDIAIASFYRLFNSAPFEQKTQFCSLNARVKKSGKGKSNLSEMKTQKIFIQSQQWIRSFAARAIPLVEGWNRSCKVYCLSRLGGSRAFDHANSVEEVEVPIKTGANVPASLKQRAQSCSLNGRVKKPSEGKPNLSEMKTQNVVNQSPQSSRSFTGRVTEQLGGWKRSCKARRLKYLYGNSAFRYIKTKEDAEALIKVGADVNARDLFGCTNLHVVQDKETIEALTMVGADVNAEGNLCKTPLQLAVKELIYTIRRDMSCRVSVCPECSEEITFRRFDQDRYLPRSIIQIQALIKAGADKNAINSQGKPLLHILADTPVGPRYDHSKNKSRSTKRCSLAKNDNFEELIMVLIGGRANVNARDDDGRTPLHYVKDEGFAKALVEAGAKVNARDSDGETPLHVVKSGGVAKVLVKARADLNARDPSGRTPLQRHKYECFAKVLVEARAIVNARDSDGKTPLHYVKDKGVAEALKANIRG